MLLKNVLLPAVTIASALASKTVSKDTVNSGAIDLSVGDITIEPNVYWSIWNNVASVFTGSLTVAKDAAFYISSNNNVIALSVTLLGFLNTITNDGTIAFNSLESLTAPTYNLVGLKFTNTKDGYVFMGGDGSVGTPVMSITAATWENDGFVTFYQKTKSTGIVALGAPLGTIKNNGDICFYNQIYHQTSKILGQGCIHAQAHSTIFLDSPLLAVDTTEIIYMEDEDSELVASTVGAVQTYTVAGFGNNNYIGLSTTIFDWNYNTISGVLTLYSDPLHLVSQKFLIGKGYVPSNFKIVSHLFPGLSAPFNNAIQYDDVVPNPGMPAGCQPCKGAPDVPPPL